MNETKSTAKNLDSTNKKPEVFSPEELTRYRADINSTRVAGSYEPGKWSVSPLNRDPLIVGTLPTQVRLRDVSLRAIDELPGVVIDEESRLAFLRQLIEAGIGDIVTTPLRGRTIEQGRRDVSIIKELNPDCIVTCPKVFTPEDFEAAREAGYDAVQLWAPPFSEASRMYEGGVHQAAWSGRDWHELDIPANRDEFIDRVAGLVREARSRGLLVTVPILMVSYLTQERLEKTVRSLAEAGANEIALFDGPGGMGPEAIAALVRECRALAPDVSIGLHVHNTFGMAVANAVSAVQAGADVVEVSVNGYCGGPGNPDLAVTVAAFEAMYGISTGINPSTLRALAEAGEALTGYHRAYNHPITGDKAYNWGGLDFMTQEVVVDELLHNCVAPSWSGSTPSVPFTEGSGPFTLWDKLVELGFNPTVPAVDALLAVCRAEMESQAHLLTDADIARLAQEQGIPRFI